MRRAFFVVLALLVPQAGQAGKPVVTSWGNAQVDFDTFNKDAVDCALYGYWRDVSGDEPAKAFIRGFKTADDLLNNPADGVARTSDSWTDSVLRTQPDRRKRQVHAIQVQDVEQCLGGRGYQPFVLKPAEISTLKRLRAGSEERKRYLYEISRQRN